MTAVEGLHCYGRGVLDEASRLLEIATDGFRKLGDEGTAALFEISRSEVAEFTGDISGARAALGRVLNVATAGHFQSSLILKSELALLLGRDGEIDQALELGREGLAAAHPPFDPVARARALFALGVAERLAGSDDLAAQHLGEAFEIHSQLDMKRELALDQTQLGLLASHRGDSLSALRHHRNAVAAAAVAGQPWTLMLSVWGLAETFIAAGDVVVGCRALGFCEAIGLREGYRRPNSGTIAARRHSSARAPADR